MNIEKWIIAHFSPTGGTRKVADAIAAGLNTPVVEMDLTKELFALHPPEQINFAKQFSHFFRVNKQEF